MSRLDRYKRVPRRSACRSPSRRSRVLAIWPGALSLIEVAALLALAGAGMGPMYPATTVIIQNAVPPHQLGIATGTLNFFRQLGGAIIVAVFAAIVLGGLDASGAASTLDTLASAASSAAEFAAPFRFVFIAAAVFLADRASSRSL